jgi:glycosyltransferase involved in cell wall biosynthesis
MLDLTIWMNYPTFYQGDLFRALTDSGEVDLRVIFAKSMPSDRVDLGWQKDMASYRHRLLDERNPVADAMALARAERRRLHIMNGLWAEPSFAAGLVTLAACRSTFAIYSEASEPELPRSTAKKVLKAGYGRMLINKAAGLLPVSHLAEDFFKSLGARERAIYPFGYFRSHGGLADSSSFKNSQGKIEVVFVGQLVNRKGVDLLIEAISPLFNQHPDLILTIIGDGERKPSLENLVKSLSPGGRVVFEGVISSAETPARIAAADLLVLPSRWDGWGLVVNEAFSVGVPVIVSDRCGTVDLVRDGANGYIFRSEDVADLRRCLSQFIAKRAEWPCFRAAARATGQRISAEQAAPYLVNCLKHMTGATSERPVPPWKQVVVAEDVA